MGFKKMAAHVTRVLAICTLVAGVAFVGSIKTANAQVLYGTLVGTVTDPTGAVIPGASVSIINTETGQVRETESDSSGLYQVRNVQAGNYDLTVTASGFRPSIQTNVSISINTTTRIDMEVQVGAVTESITVEASAAVLQTETSDVSTQLEEVAMANLPIGNYRNYQELINLVPGATPARFQNAITDTPALGLSTNVNGVNRNSNNTRLDGTANIYIWLPHHTVYVAPVETIEAVNISTDNFDAEQGTTGGAAITVNTKSGTNDFHGSVFELHDDSGLRAFKWEENRSGVTNKPHSVRNIFGGTVGGPIIKNKLFFFGGWEATYERLNFSRTFSVPVDNLRLGDFNRVMGADILDEGAQILVPTTEGGSTPLREGMIFDPLSGNLDGTGRSVFSDGGVINVIPTARLNTGMMNMLGRVPLPNLSGDTDNLFRSAVGEMNRNNFDAKVNWNRTVAHQMFFKYSNMDAQVLGKFGLGEAGGRCLCNGGNGVGDTMVQLATIGSTWTASPTFLIDGTIGWTRMGQEVIPPDLELGQFGVDVLGVPGMNGTDPRTHGMPRIDIAGFSSLGNRDGWSPIFRNDQTYTGSINASWLKGDHDLRFGFDTVRHHLNHWQPELGSGPRGRLRFSSRDITALNGGGSGTDFNALAAFMLGTANSVGKSVQFIKMDSFENQYAMYLRDRWHVTPKLTLTIGVRWELYPTRHRSNGLGMEGYDTATNEVLVGGRGSIPRDVGVGYSKKLFAPRLGFAYRLTDSTVFRGGYGLTYNPMVFSRPLRGFFPQVVASDFNPVNGFQIYNTDPNISDPDGDPLTNDALFGNLPLGTGGVVGIPQICCPDISTGRVTLPTAALMGYAKDNQQLTRGYIQSWNATFEQKFPGDFVTSIAYVGTAQTKGFAFLDINAGQTFGAGNDGRPLFGPHNRTTTTNLWNGWTNSTYHSLQIALNRRMVSGLFVKGAYTWSHAINMTDDDGWTNANVEKLDSLSRNRATAGFERDHVFRMATIYELPFGAGKQYAPDGPAAMILGGWQVNSIVSLFQGTRRSVSASGSSMNLPSSSQWADQVGPIVYLGGVGDASTPFFETSAFANVTSSSPGGGERFGTSGRNILQGPGVVNVDLSLFRTFGITEIVKLQFRAEAFNISNTPHFNNPNTSVTSSSFGRITSTNVNFKERQLRFGLRLSW